MMALAIVLTGCNTVDFDAMIGRFGTPYTEPSGEGLARLRVITEGTTRLIPNSDCVDWHLPGAGSIASRNTALLNDKTFNDRSLGMPLNGKGKGSSEVYVAGGKSLVLASTEGNKYIDITFTPESGVDYEFRPICTWNNCIATLSRLIVAPETNSITTTPVPFTKATFCWKKHAGTK